MAMHTKATIITPMIMAITMTELTYTALLRLLSWLSPAFPTGSYAYSNGLEAAYALGSITTAEELEAWISASLETGSGWCDGVLLSLSWRGIEPPETLAEMAQALAGSAGRLRETTGMGAGFVAAASHWPNASESLPDTCPLPIAVGHIARQMQVPLEASLCAYLHSLASSLVQAALRMGRLGQGQGVGILARAEPLICATALRAKTAGFDDLYTSGFSAEMMALHQETLSTRIFRS